MPNNLETCSLLVRLYADYKHYVGDDIDYAEAVARAISALSKEDEDET